MPPKSAPGGDPGLFAEQPPDGPYPKELLVASKTAGGLRYVSVGEDGEYVAFLGHPASADVVAAAEALEISWGNAADHAPPAEALVYTHGRLWTSCPDHATPADACPVCHLGPGEWWLDWSDPHGRTGAAHPESVPITVWSVEV